MRLFVSKNLMFLFLALMLIQPLHAEAKELLRDDALFCLNETTKFEKKYEIKEHLLTTISAVEAGKWSEKHMQKLAWPWTINANGKSIYLNSKSEAVAKVKELQKKGVKSIDVGCMQINLAYHGDAFKSLDEAFTPSKNVEYGAKFLKSLYEKKDGNWIKAAMAYHSSVPHKANKYKAKVMAQFEKVKLAQNEIGNLLVKKIKNLRTAKNLAKRSKFDANAWREAKLAEYHQKNLER